LHSRYRHPYMGKHIYKPTSASFSSSSSSSFIISLSTQRNQSLNK